MYLPKTVIFELGVEHAPDSPWGMDRLKVEPDGRFSYENRQSGHVLRTRTGRIETSALDEIARDLTAANFPSVPAHSMPPGGNYLTIIAKADGGDQEAFMRGSAAERFAGYGPLLRRIREWVQYLRGHSLEASPSALHVDP